MALGSKDIIKLVNMNVVFNKNVQTKVTETSDSELMGPTRDTNYSPNQPKLSTMDIESVQNSCLIAISNMPLSLMPHSLREVLNNNRADQKRLKGLEKYPNALATLLKLMDDDVEFKTFPQKIWNYQTETITWNSLEYY